MNLMQLKSKLFPAIRHIEILCKGFSVIVEPPYKEVLDTVCVNIENGLKNTNRDIEEILFKLSPQGRKIKTLSAKKDSVWVKDNTKEPHEHTVKQFKEKFIKIAKTEMIPVLKEYCRKNPIVDIGEFRPLFDIKITIGTK